MGKDNKKTSVVCACAAYILVFMLLLGSSFSAEPRFYIVVICNLLFTLTSFIFGFVLKHKIEERPWFWLFFFFALLLTSLYVYLVILA